MIVVLSDYDSRIKWGLTLGRAICDNLKLSEEELHLYYKAADNEIFQLYDIENSNKFLYTNLLTLVTNEFLLKVDILILAIGGPDNLRVLSKCNTLENRPICITGFNGVIDPQDPHGLLCRYGADYICVNSEVDLKKSQEILKKLCLDYSNLVCTGYLRKKFIKNTLHAQKPMWLFVEQIGIPNTLSRMVYLFNALVDLALRNPQVEVVVKSRTQNGISNVNSNKSREIDLQDIWNVYKSKIPKNLSINDSCSIEKLVSEAELCIAFSSTVLLEALFLKKNIAVLNDFGIDKKIGNYVFLGSGALVNSYQINNGYTCDINAQWLEQNCIFNRLDVFLNRLEIQFSSKTQLGSMSLYYSDSNTPFFYKKVKISWFVKVILRIKKCLS